MPPVPPYEPLDFLVVRAPLLPVEACPAIPRPPGDPCRAAARQGPGGAVLPPLPRLALAVASPPLVAALDRALPGSRAARRAGGTLLRYLIRMSSRPTPFGLFAGVALARWGDRTDLALADEPPRTRTRPDMAWLMRLVLAAEARPAVRRQLRMVANPAATLHGGRVWLAERAPTGGEAPEPAVSLRATGAVRCALAAARQPVAWTELAAALLASTPGATPGRVERLLTDLWAQTVLLTDLRPPLTTADPAGWVAARLAAVPAAEDLAAE